ncbi:MAG: DUF4856 domain-containing protein [Myxococcota bacterium]|nr:DUF4856 domain-containing protein [Myxococcota bacterium]
MKRDVRTLFANESAIILRAAILLMSASLMIACGSDDSDSSNASGGIMADSVTGGTSSTTTNPNQPSAMGGEAVSNQPQPANPPQGTDNGGAPATTDNGGAPANTDNGGAPANTDNGGAPADDDMTAACEKPADAENVAEKTYAFGSVLEGNEDKSSVSYSGQIRRHATMNIIKGYIGALDDGNSPAEGEIYADLMLHYNCYVLDDTGEPTLGEDDKPLKTGCDAIAVGVTTEPATAQATLSDIGNGTLRDKLAGNDAKGQHKNWKGDDSDRNGNDMVDDGEAIGEPAFVSGWKDDAGKNYSPEALLQVWFNWLDEAAVAKGNMAGAKVTIGGVEWALPVHITKDGLDLTQLVQKFLLGAVAFSQGADDYLDDDIPGAGLNSKNVGPCKDGKAYTCLEHIWDEGFGYFGAARDYLAYTDDQIAKKCPGIMDPGYAECIERPGYFDTDENGDVDLTAEYNWGHSQNAAKRDRDSACENLTMEAYTAFYEGRKLITSAAGSELTAAQLDALKGYRDTAILAWEKAIAATVIHYINDTLKDMAAEPYDFMTFKAHAKHWGEMKGFALSFQFNPRSPLNEAAGQGTKFEAIHEKFGTKPVIPTVNTAEEVEAYKAGLLEARDMMRDAYGFDAADAADW